MRRFRVPGWFRCLRSLCAGEYSTQQFQRERETATMKDAPMHVIRAFVVAVFFALLFGALVTIVVLPAEDRQRMFDTIKGNTR
jgi:hypothetical protein